MVLMGTYDEKIPQFQTLPMRLKMMQTNIENFNHGYKNRPKTEKLFQKCVFV